MAKRESCNVLQLTPRLEAEVFSITLQNCWQLEQQLKNIKGRPPTIMINNTRVSLEDHLGAIVRLKKPVLLIFGYWVLNQTTIRQILQVEGLAGLLSHVLLFGYNGFAYHYKERGAQLIKAAILTSLTVEVSAVLGLQN
jgi:hypothetical protein